MSYRMPPLITGNTYHIFNRGVDRRPIYTCKAEYQRAMLALEYYLPVGDMIKLSYFLEMTDDNRQQYLAQHSNDSPLVSIFSFCLMSNHFHLLLRQEVDNGISTYMSLIQNSYTQYFNNRHDRSGRLFESTFKSVRIESHQQLVHVSRYIHLNPYSARMLKNVESVVDYPFSSMRSYASNEQGFVEHQTVLSQFRNNHSYINFVLNKPDYERSINRIDHLVFDDQPTEASLR